MKNAFLIAITAFSMNATAQGHGPIHAQHSTVSSTLQNSLLSFQHNESITLGSRFDKKPEAQIKTNNTTLLLSIRTDSTYTWIWNPLHREWDLHSKNDYYVYDANNNNTSYIGQSWNGITWENSDMHTHTYDASNNVTSATYQTWTGSDWINTSRNVYTYDANNNKTSETYQSWHDAIWVDAFSKIYSFDANNNLLTYTYKIWNSYYFQFIYTYDANNNQTSS